MPPTAHVIRLRGPWRVCALNDGAYVDEQTLYAPYDLCEIISLLDRDEIVCTRRFGRPDKLEESESVWLTFSQLDPRAIVYLNGRQFEASVPDGPFANDITTLLQMRNELVIKCERPIKRNKAWTLWSDAQLEIRRIG